MVLSGHQPFAHGGDFLTKRKRKGWILWTCLQSLLKGVTRSAPHPTWVPTSPSHLLSSRHLVVSALLTQQPSAQGLVVAAPSALEAPPPDNHLVSHPHPPPLFRSQLKCYSSERPALMTSLPDNPAPSAPAPAFSAHVTRWS